jgi:hypothetical protein
MSERTKIYVLGGLIFALVLAVYFVVFDRTSVPGLTGVLAADTKFQPLDVQEPDLHLDKLAKLRKLEYSGSHRNIFVAGPPPILPPTGPAAAPPRIFIGPKPPPPPPPPQLPAQFFGYAAQAHSGKRVGFFTNNDDVLVVAEGDKFLNNYRRHFSVALVEPPAQGSDQ